MMFSIPKRNSFFSILLTLSVFIGGNTAFGQVVIEPVETINLYEQVNISERSPVITCVDLDKNGRLLAIGGDDRTVRLWDLQRKEFVMQLQDHLDWVRGLTFSPDRTRLATVGQDGQIKIWNTETGSLVRTVRDTVRGAQKIVFHPNGTRFAVCGFDRNVRIYDTTNGSLLETLLSPGTGNRAIAYSADGAFLAVAGRSGVIRVWRTTDTRTPVDLKGDQRRVNALAFNSSGTMIATAGDGPFVMLWNPTDGQLLGNLPERPGKTFSLAFCGDTYLASGESDNAIRIWDLSKKQQTATLMGHTGTISTMIFEESSQRLITGSFDTSVRFWPTSGELTAPTSGPAFAAPIAPSFF